MKAGKFTMRKKKKGLTLIELIVVIAVMTILFNIIFQIFTSCFQLYTSGMNSDEAQSTGVKVMNDVSQSISDAQTVDATVYGDNFTLKTSSNTTIGVGQEKVIITSATIGGTPYCYVIYNKILYKCTNISISDNSSSNCSSIGSNINDLVISSTGNNLSNINLTVIVNGGNPEEFQTNITKRNMGV